MFRLQQEGHMLSNDYHFHYFTEHNSDTIESYMDMVRILAKRVVYSDKMGNDKRIWDIYGLSAKDLGDLDYAEFMRYKKDVDELEAEYIKKLEQQLRDAEQKGKDLNKVGPPPNFNI